MTSRINRLVNQTETTFYGAGHCATMANIMVVKYEMYFFCKQKSILNMYKNNNLKNITDWSSFNVGTNGIKGFLLYVYKILEGFLKQN